MDNTKLQILIDIQSRLEGLDKAVAQAAELNAMGEASVETATLAAQAQEKIALQMERRVILETQLEAAEARIAGNAAMAQMLEREADIRTRALGVQQALNVSTEEAIVLAERLVLAEEAQAAPTALAGVNLGKARAEATTLARELATGSVNGRTLGALLGSLGTTITIAGLAAYELYGVITRSSDESLKLTQEYAKQTAELDKQIDKWIELAKSAKSFGDVVKLGLDMGPALAAASLKFAEFRNKELSNWEKFVDLLSVAFNSRLSVGLHGFSLTVPQGPNQAAQDAATKQSAANLKTLLADANALNDQAQRTVDTWEKFKLLPPSEGITFYSEQIDKLQAKRAALEDSRHTSTTAFNEYAKAGQDILVLQEHVDELTKAQEKLNATEAKSDRKTDLQDVNALLRQQQALIASIHQQEQLIDANTFLSPDAKQAATLAAMTAEMAALGREIDADKAKLAGGTLDPVTYERVSAEVQKLQFDFDLLGLKTQTLKLPFQAELANWVNSFGTAAHQVAGLIEGTINAALQGTNQLLLDSIFQTGDWHQTLIGVERQILNLFLTFLEQQALQFIQGETQKATATATSIASHTAQMPAATAHAAAEGISSWGLAAIIGGAAVVAAIALIEGGFESGGYTGGRRGKAAGVVHGEEYVFDAESVDRIGVGNLDRMRGYARGGHVVAYDPDAGIEPGEIPGTGDWDFYGPWGGAPNGEPTVQVFVQPRPAGQPTVDIHPAGPEGPSTTAGGADGPGVGGSTGIGTWDVAADGFLAPGVPSIFNTVYPTSFTNVGNGQWAAFAQPAGGANAGAFGGPIGFGADIFAGGFGNSVAAGLHDLSHGHSASEQQFAGGGLTTGAVDAIAGVVHGGEYVEPMHTVDFYGPEIFEAMRRHAIAPERVHELMSRARVHVPSYQNAFAQGGLAAAIAPSGITDSITNSKALRPMQIFMFSNIKDAIAAYHASGEADKHIVNAVDGNRVELGL